MLARAFICLICLTVIPASAQQAPPVVYQLKLEARQVGDVVDALSERPFKQVAPIIQEIGRQIQEQNAAREWEKKQPAAPVPAPQEPQK